MGDRLAGASVVPADGAAQRSQRAMRRRCEQIGEADRRVESKVSSPVFGLGSPVLAPVGEAKEEPGYFLFRQLRVRLGQPSAVTSYRGQVAGVGGVLPGNDVNSAAHVSVNHEC